MPSLATHTPAFADAALFMGMHSAAEPIRIACKNFFVRRLGRPLAMTLEQIGLCDDVVWNRPRDVQDLYYPFMDQLHTVMRAARMGYSHEDIRRAEQDSRLCGLDAARALLMARVCNDAGLLYTADPELLGRGDLPVTAVAPGEELRFPEPIEAAYCTSLALRVAVAKSAIQEHRRCSAG